MRKSDWISKPEYCSFADSEFRWMSVKIHLIFINSCASFINGWDKSNEWLEFFYED